MRLETTFLIIGKKVSPVEGKETERRKGRRKNGRKPSTSQAKEEGNEEGWFFNLDPY